MRTTLRILLVIPIAFLAACIAAGAFVVLAAYGAGTGTVSGTAEATAGELVVLTLSAAAVIGAFSFVPALVAIALAETFSWRSLVLYLLAGCAVAFAAVALLVPPERAVSDVDTPLFLAAGAVAGVVYWLIAGRTAGHATTRRRG